MIWYRGHEYGTAAQVAARLGPDITTAMVRRWADRGRVDRHKLADGGALFRVDQAAAEERRTRTSGRGRPRRGAT